MPRTSLALQRCHQPTTCFTASRRQCVGMGMGAAESTFKQQSPVCFCCELLHFQGSGSCEVHLHLRSSFGEQQSTLQQHVDVAAKVSQCSACCCLLQHFFKTRTHRHLEAGSCCCFCCFCRFCQVSRCSKKQPKKRHSDNMRCPLRHDQNHGESRIPSTLALESSTDVLNTLC